MRTLIVVAALVLGAWLAIPAPEAACVYCPTFRCYAPCGAGCVCIMPPGTLQGGTCYGVQEAEALVARGWTELS